KWSRTAASNATADGSINWAEGQAPSTVNDSARAMMAAASKYRDDVAGAIATAGTGTAYTLASYQVFDTLAHMDGAMIVHGARGQRRRLHVERRRARREAVALGACDRAPRRHAGRGHALRRHIL